MLTLLSQDADIIPDLGSRRQTKEEFQLMCTRSFHTALKPQSLAEFRDCWDTILQRVTHVA